MRDDGNLLELAEAYSTEWLSAFPWNEADLFMILQVCADESYRFQEYGVCTVAIGGWIAHPDNFKGFCPRWASVLKKYGVDYFHFKEYADKKHLHHKKTIYDHLSDRDREDFLFDLALVACEVGVPIGACTAEDREPTTEFFLVADAFRWFFSGVQDLLKQKFDTNDKADFIFDENDNRSWELAASEMFKMFQKRGAPFGSRIYSDDKVFMPLQAADLYVYAMRQNGERFFDKDHKPQPRLLDLILDKNRPEMENWKFKSQHWETIMREVIAHFREWSKTNNSRDYRPLLHCPLLQNNESDNSI